VEPERGDDRHGRIDPGRALRGRFALGLGASTQQLTEGLRDITFAAPVDRMRGTVTQVRALLRGERVPLAVVNGARALKLNVPRQEIPIHLAGLADESIRLAREVADGWLPFRYPRDRLALGKRLLQEGAARTGDPWRRIVVHSTIPAVVSDDLAKIAGRRCAYGSDEEERLSMRIMSRSGAPLPAPQKATLLSTGQC
jgi:alkanesulfonate monooxygenase SsuD/methylene tetrahydromethanopterin reductase-like flavin-dependent oxidoreductase (luciferase family)